MPSPTLGSVSYATLGFYDSGVLLARPSGVANGDVLLLIGHIQPGSANHLTSNSLPSGFTSLYQPVSGLGVVGWKRVTDVAAEPSSYTVIRQGGAGMASLALQLITGVSTPTPIATAGVGFALGTSGTTATYPVFSAPANSLVIYLAAADREGSWVPTTAGGLTHRWLVTDWTSGEDSFAHQITLKTRSIATAETTASYAQTSSFSVNWHVSGIVMKSEEPPAAPVVTSSLTASGQFGTALTYQITASNTPTSFSATGLPAGLSLNTSTGAITGTPTTAGVSDVTIGATNAGGSGTATLVLTIAAAPVLGPPPGSALLLGVGV